MNKSNKNLKSKAHRAAAAAVASKASKCQAPETAQAASKLAVVITLLRRKEGATIEQMMKGTGWQSHSVRGAISGALKKKHGLNITSSKTDGVRSYRIA